MLKCGQFTKSEATLAPDAGGGGHFSLRLHRVSLAGRTPDDEPIKNLAGWAIMHERAHRGRGGRTRANQSTHRYV
jgi:hypothetical protein